jgi:hypothetical protein
LSSSITLETIQVEHLNVRCLASVGNMFDGYHACDEILFQDWLSILYHLSTYLKQQQQPLRTNSTDETENNDDDDDDDDDDEGEEDNETESPVIVTYAEETNLDGQQNIVHGEQEEKDGEEEEEEEEERDKERHEDITIKINNLEGIRLWNKFSCYGRSWCLLVMYYFRAGTHNQTKSPESYPYYEQREDEDDDPYWYFTNSNSEFYHELSQLPSIPDQIAYIHSLIQEKCSSMLISFGEEVIDYSAVIFQQLLQQYGRESILVRIPFADHQVDIQLSRHHLVSINAPADAPNAISNGTSFEQRMTNLFQVNN